jgi:hypothetical protein
MGERSSSGGDTILLSAANVKDNFGQKLCSGSIKTSQIIGYLALLIIGMTLLKSLHEFIEKYLILKAFAILEKSGQEIPLFLSTPTYLPLNKFF